MDLGIKGKSALVFGGSRGIGRAVAGALAAEGANVAVCARKEWAARKVAAEAAERGRVKAVGYPLDAWDEPSAAALMDRVIADFGAIDILFGIARRTLREDRPTLSWGARLDNGFLRFKAATEALLPGMQRRQWGRVLWMVPWPIPGTAAERHFDSVTSAALPAWLQSVAAEVARENVTLNVLKPAPVWRTTDKDPASASGPRPEPADETLSVSEVAAVAAFLLSDPARGLYGRTIEFGSRSAVSLQQRPQDLES